MTEIFSFHNMGIAPKLIETLDELKLTEPTPIQRQAIPAAIEGKDVVGIAQTGTGKTLAFSVPMIQRLSDESKRGLVLVPTRELALQAEETIRKVGRSYGIRTAILIGGASMNRQNDMLDRDPHIVIATPGRLIDHLEQKTIRLDSVGILVLDEADRMLDMGFWPQIRRIITVVPKDRQTMCFSATLSREIMQLASGHMNLPVRIEVAPSGTTAEKVTQEFFILRKDEKPRLLEKLLGEHHGTTIVFTKTKHGAKKLMRLVARMGHTAAEIHGNRSLSQRREALEGFKNGRYRVLVATDIAARGIDVKGIDLVINYDMPTASEDYVHRIGRTARAGADGHAITFTEPQERRALRDIEHLIRMPIPVSQLPELPPARAQEYVERDEDRHHAPRGRSGGGGRSFGGGRGGGGFSRGGGGYRR